MWKSISKKEAENLFNNLDFQNLIIDEGFAELRNNLLHSFDKILEEGDMSRNEIKGNLYELDLKFGMEVYQLLTFKYSLKERQASDDGIWRHLSTSVVPDLVELRWGNNPQRFYLESRRIWLKVLWWYIHLSWQGNPEETLKVLKDNTSDEVVQLVERSGSNGYRIELYRDIMLYYGNIPKERKKRSNQIFRRVMKLNTARSKVVEPLLVEGGTKMYVKELFDYFD